MDSDLEDRLLEQAERQTLILDNIERLLRESAPRSMTVRQLYQALALTGAAVALQQMPTDIALADSTVTTQSLMSAIVDMREGLVVAAAQIADAMIARDRAREEKDDEPPEGMVRGRDPEWNGMD